MIASERRRWILEELNQKGILSLKEAVKGLGTSEITVRRDFEKLEKEGKLKRVQGGATIEGTEDSAELTMQNRILLNIREKEIVAKYAVGLVKDGQSVFIDSGTSMLPLFLLLSSRPVTIVSNNTIALRKLVRPVADIILIGGRYQAHYDMSTGFLAQDMLKNFSFDVAFIGCTGINLKSREVFTSEFESHAMKKIAMAASAKKYLLVDNTKFEKRGFVKLSDFSEFDKIITDSFISDAPIPDNIVMV